jgi:hypothetical protein
VFGTPWDGSGVVVWNGQRVRLARRDVEIHHEPESCTVEARQGGPEGEAKRWPAETEDQARKMAEQLMRMHKRRRSMDQAISSGLLDRNRPERA